MPSPICVTIGGFRSVPLVAQPLHQRLRALEVVLLVRVDVFRGHEAQVGQPQVGLAHGGRTLP